MELLEEKAKLEVTHRFLPQRGFSSRWPWFVSLCHFGFPGWKLSSNSILLQALCCVWGQWVTADLPCVSSRGSGSSAPPDETDQHFHPKIWVLSWMAQPLECWGFSGERSLLRPGLCSERAWDGICRHLPKRHLVLPQDLLLLLRCCHWTFSSLWMLSKSRISRYWPPDTL